MSLISVFVSLWFSLPPFLIDRTSFLHSLGSGWVRVLPIFKLPIEYDRLTKGRLEIGNTLTHPLLDSPAMKRI
jgi:hypothetical protein